MGGIIWIWASNLKLNLILNKKINQQAKIATKTHQIWELKLFFKTSHAATYLNCAILLSLHEL